MGGRIWIRNGGRVIRVYFYTFITSITTTIMSGTRWEPAKHDGAKKDYKEAVWQYLVDHGQFVGRAKKMMRVVVYLHNRHDFEWRVKARMMGVYRNDEKELSEEYKTFMSEIDIWRWEKRFSKNFDRLISSIDAGKRGIMEKVALWPYRQSRDYIRLIAEHEATLQDLPTNHKQPVRARGAATLPDEASQVEQGGAGVGSKGSVQAKADDGASKRKTSVLLSEQPPSRYRQYKNAV